MHMAAKQYEIGAACGAALVSHGTSRKMYFYGVTRGAFFSLQRQAYYSTVDTDLIRYLFRMPSILDRELEHGNGTFSCARG